MTRSHALLWGTPLVLAVDTPEVFYQTGWFAGLCLLTALAAAALGYRWRVQRLQANERRLEALVAHRTWELSERTQQLHIANALLEELATIDGLTNVANRRRLDLYLQQEWQRATRAHTTISMLLLDVDDFKRFNDTYGHQAGDDCLRAVADVLRTLALRGADLPARFGGEEFAVVLPETPADGARVVADSIREAIAALAIPHPDSTVAGHVTVSVGVASAQPGQGATTAGLIAACDRALYRAKQMGRNRTVVAE